MVYSRLKSALAGALLLVTVCNAADSPWMTPEAERNATAALLSRMASLNLPMEGSEQEQFSSALAVIRGMTQRIDDWGLPAILSDAPRFLEATAPTLPSPLGQAIAAYGACGVSLYPELARDQQEKFFMVGGEFSVFLISGFLRHHYLQQGGTDEALRMELTSPAMEQYSKQVQADQNLIGQVLETCQPFFLKVIGQPQSAD